MNSREIGTSFRTPEFLEGMNLPPEERRIITNVAEYLGVNRDVRPYTDEEADKAAETMERLIRVDGFDPILHIVTSPFTAGWVRDATPEQFRPHIEEIYYQVEGRIVQIDPRFAENVIHVSIDGTITLEDQEKMHRLLQNRIGVCIGGGPGYPSDPSRTPLLRELEAALREKTPMVGVCLGHQDLAHIAGAPMIPGIINAGSQIETPTAAGQSHPVYSRLGDTFGAQAYNTVAVPQKEGISGVAVLTESPTTGLWAALSYRDAFEGKDQAFSTQHHPEIPVGTDYPTREPGKDFTVNFGGEIVQVSGNLSSGQRALVDYASRLWELGKKAGMTVEDVRALIDPQRAYPTLGREFFGPTFEWLANKRTKI
ncbi:MAG TPA: hypothetical protein DCY48_04015 [Candidatus Magasanikbacteria bacterium]|nr:MAG: hypothetical protein A3I74_00430 [Candidatus Magasanikbacteria bacterium RIFCSPLOWO2_02_FULL_47_16]OGH80083.1 MAG: hypothetical protein A3C10_02795 [Candidatus Magasanikbacteria bacterium RIFCSPHIGHO2_02_FULL_48_18]OGH83332.1 MAG: hypothetical protein A3G08_00305 [Candidatus Magasanikbacteria bacterium RIFCSPLOWO2_12_FULL_47_9b]HAZ28910.1 hypothetical protein [Candidatus Magasanikbacteria bacterium]